MKTLLFILFSFACLSGFSQIIVSGQVKGRITNDRNEPVPFAAIKIMTTDSLKKVVTEKITNEQGKYDINLADTGKYLFSISSAGYETLSQEIVIEKENSELNFTLNKSSEDLKDVTVTSSASMIQKKADRLIMTVENNPISTGKSSMEVIGLAPGVFIHDNKISINGNSGTRIMVDGKILNLGGQDLVNYLNALRAEDIKSIEVIAHPPAEYDAQGTGGLINIVLKKNRNAGINGNVYANWTQGRYPGHNEGASINYKKNKFSLYSNGSYSAQTYFNELHQERTFPENKGSYIADNNSVGNNANSRWQIGSAYDITDNQYISLEYNGSQSNSSEKFHSVTQSIFTSNTDSNQHTTGYFPSLYKSRYHNASLKYQWKTDTLGSAFTLLSDYTRNKSNNTNNAFNSTFNNRNTILADTAYNNRATANAAIFTADAKFLKVFNEKHKLTAGAKITSTYIQNASHFEYRENGNWLVNNTQNYKYNYDEKILAGYISYEAKILNTNIQFGLRGENTQLTGTLINKNKSTPSPNHYFKLFPSMYISRILDKKNNHAVNASYNRRLNRPAFWQLNPYEGYIDSYTVGRGNPYLQPELSNSAELGYTLKSKYIFTLNYTRNNNVINNVIRNDETEPMKMIQQPINSGKQEVYAFMALIPVNITKWWTTQNTFMYNYQKLNAPKFNIEQPYWILQTNQTLKVNETTSFTITGFYINKILFANSVINGFSGLNAGFSKKLWDDRLTIKANVNDIFYTQRLKGKFYYEGLDLHFRQQQQSRRFTLGITYNFKTGKAFNMKKLESSNTEEQKRLNK